MSAIFRLIKYASTSKEERDVARTAPMEPGVFGEFPTVFRLFYTGPGKDYMSQGCFLGLDVESRLYAVTFHNGYGPRQMTLYSTAESAPPALAIASNEKRYGDAATITLPAASSNGGETTRVEKLKANFSATVYSFILTVGRGGFERVEKFEWREDKRPKPKIRRLFQIDRDELEPLAIWTEGTVPGKDGRLATFEFLGSGMTGERGDYWALVAVVTALRICQTGWAALAGAHSQDKEWDISFHTGERWQTPGEGKRWIPPGEKIGVPQPRYDPR